MTRRLCLLCLILLVFSPRSRQGRIALQFAFVHMALLLSLSCLHSSFFSSSQGRITLRLSFFISPGKHVPSSTVFLSCIRLDALHCIARSRRLSAFTPLALLLPSPILPLSLQCMSTLYSAWNHTLYMLFHAVRPSRVSCTSQPKNKTPHNLGFFYKRRESGPLAPIPPQRTLHTPTASSTQSKLPAVGSLKLTPRTLQHILVPTRVVLVSPRTRARTHRPLTPRCAAAVESSFPPSLQVHSTARMAGWAISPSEGSGGETRLGGGRAVGKADRRAGECVDELARQLPRDRSVEEGLTR